jgi:hypothetical protein
MSGSPNKSQYVMLLSNDEVTNVNGFLGCEVIEEKATHGSEILVINELVLMSHTAN